MAGYKGLRRVKLAWNNPPAAANTYIGLANFTADRWDWYKVNAKFEATLPEFTRYTGPSEQMLVCVVLLGTTPAGLRYVLVGDNWISLAVLQSDLNSDPTKNFAPLTVNFDSQNSVSWGGTIVNWDWDWDSDGVWDSTGNPAGLASHTFAAGNWKTTVRVTDDGGATGTSSLEFVAVNPANQPPQAEFTVSDNFGNAPLQVHFDAQTAADPDGALIKYEWDFDDDSEFELDNGAVPDVWHTLARKGLNTVTLRVTDNDLATDTFSLGINLSTGWGGVVIDNDVRVDDQTAMAALGSGLIRAGVAYRDLTNKELRFAIANTANGSTWGPWVSPDATALSAGYSPSMVALPGTGAPLIAYGVYDAVGAPHSQYVVSAMDGAAAAWNSPVLVDAGHDVGEYSSLALINNIPAIAAVVNGGSASSYLNYYLAQNGSGSAWNPGETIIVNSDDFIYGGLALGPTGSGAFKHPALAFDRRNMLSETGFMAANDVIGADWSAPLIFSGIETSTHSIMTVGGNPALIAGDPYQNGNMYYCRANDANGAIWGAPVQIGGGGYGSLVLLNGFPVACYYDSEGEDLYFVGAKDASGNAWNDPYIVDSVGWVGKFCSMVVSNGSPVICYWDESHNTLKAAYWQ